MKDVHLLFLKPVKTQWEAYWFVFRCCDKTSWPRHLWEERVHLGWWLQRRPCLEEAWQWQLEQSAESPHALPQAPSTVLIGICEAFYFESMPHMPHLLSVSNSTTKLGTKCLNAWDCGWHFLFKPPKWLIVSFKCLIKSHLTSFWPSSLSTAALLLHFLRCCLCWITSEWYCIYTTQGTLWWASFSEFHEDKGIVLFTVVSLVPRTVSQVCLMFSII